MSDIVSRVYYVLEVKEYDSGVYWAAFNLGGGKVSISGKPGELKELLEKVFSGAMNLRFEEPTEPEPMVG